MAKPKKATGQITFRCPVEQHEELLEIATILGVDLNGLLNMMLKEVLPYYRQRAQQEAEKHKNHERLGSPEVGIPTEEPVIRQMILAARQAPFHDRVEVLRDHARRFSDEGDPPVDETVLFAVELMDRATALHQLRRMRFEKRRFSLEPDQDALVKQMEERLEQEIDKLKEQREQARARSTKEGRR